MDVGHNILQERLKKGVTQATLATRSGISQPNLSAIEKGRRDMTVSTLRQIALALGVQAGILLGDDSQSHPPLALSRTRIENIAQLVVRPGKLAGEADGPLALLFRQVLPATGTKRRPAKQTLRSWLELRGQLDQNQIRSILARIQDESMRVA